MMESVYQPIGLNIATNSPSLRVSLLMPTYTSPFGFWIRSISSITRVVFPHRCSLIIMPYIGEIMKRSNVFLLQHILNILKPRSFTQCQ